MKKTARFLRKLADFFDPRIDPSRDLVIRVDVDVEQACKNLGRIAKASVDAAQASRHFDEFNAKSRISINDLRQV